MLAKNHQRKCTRKWMQSKNGDKHNVCRVQCAKRNRFFSGIFAKRQKCKPFVSAFSVPCILGIPANGWDTSSWMNWGIFPEKFIFAEAFYGDTSWSLCLQLDWHLLEAIHRFWQPLTSHHSIHEEWGWDSEFHPVLRMETKHINHCHRTFRFGPRLCAFTCD